MPGFANGPTGNSIMWSDNIDFSGAVIPTETVTTDGQLIIGSTATPNLKIGTVTSPNGTLRVGYSSPNITLDVVGGSSVTSVTGTANRITSTGGTTPVIDISASYVGQTSITTLGTVTTGTWIYKVTTPGAYPYTTLASDQVILVDTSSARTITPLGSPTTGQTYRIKDSVGSAASNNITITPSGKNIDGAASATINVAYGSVDITYNGTEWSIL